MKMAIHLHTKAGIRSNRFLVSVIDSGVSFYWYKKCQLEHVFVTVIALTKNYTEAQLSAVYFHLE